MLQGEKWGGSHPAPPSMGPCMYLSLSPCSFLWSPPATLAPSSSPGALGCMAFSPSPSSCPLTPVSSPYSPNSEGLVNDGQDHPLLSLLEPLRYPAPQQEPVPQTALGTAPTTTTTTFPCPGHWCLTPAETEWQFTF